MISQILSAPRRARLFSAGYVLVWALLLFWFAARDIPNLCSDLRHGHLVGTTPNTSTNVFLQALLRIPNAAERFDALFSQLAASSRLIFVAPAHDDRWIFVYAAVSYLAWPRKIDNVELHPHQQFKADESTGAVIIFCGLPPAVHSPNQWRIGPNMVVVPMPTAAK